MPDKVACTIRARKSRNNRLLQRKQMILDIYHPGRANISKAELREQISREWNIISDLIFLYGFRTEFGGGKSTGFCSIYDNMDVAKKVEPKFRLIRAGILPKRETSRRTRKESKNKKKKVRGKGKAKVGKAGTS